MRKEVKIYLLMVLAAFLWSGAFIAAKFTAPYIPSSSVTTLRFAIATVMIYCMMKWNQKQEPDTAYHFDRRDVSHFLFCGIVGMVGYHIFFFEAMKYTTAINSSIIRAIDPILTVVLAAIFLHQKAPVRQIFGVVLSLAGVVLTITGGNLADLASVDLNRGDLYMLGAVLSWSAYGIYTKSRCSHIPPVALTFYSFLVCTMVLLPFSLMEKPWVFLPEVPASAWLALLFMAVFCSGIAYYIQQIALRVIGPTRSAIFVNLVPVFSFILATLILGEELQPVKILTTVLIIAGVCICQLTGNGKEEQMNGK